MKKRSLMAATLFLAALFPLCARDFAPLFPFQPTHRAPDNITNVRTWAGADGKPAGDDGFITTQGDHFVDGDGRVRRFIGTNIGMTGCFPTHEAADMLAPELARYGINIVRMHYVSHRTPKEGYPVKDSFMEPVQLERFDYFFARLKKNGIYVYFQLNIARKVSAANGFENLDKLPKYKNGVDNVDERMIELQERFHREILEHVNPYTGLMYKDDPAIAMFELANENSIVNSWFKPSYHFPDLVEPYKGYFVRLWNEWLERKYGDLAPLKKKWGKYRGGMIDWPYDSNWTVKPDRALDFTEFLADLEKSYFARLYRNVKDSLGVRQPVTGTQLEYGFNQPQALMDYCDIHGYWCHPGFRKGWDWNNFTIRNGAIINSFGHPGSTFTQIARARILGRPFTVSEYDHPNLNYYCAEGDIMLAAMGAFQNWSGLMQFAWILNTDYSRDYVNPMFDMCSAPQKLVHFPACWAMFVRGDVRSGSESVVFAYPSEYGKDIKAVAEGRNAGAHGEHKSGLLNSLPLAVVSGRQVVECPELFSGEGSTVIREAADVPDEIADAWKNKYVRSLTGELIWDWQKKDAGVFMVDTRRTKVFCGFVRGRTFTYRGMTLTPGETRLDWLTLTLTLAYPYGGGKPGNILQPGEYLLAATGVVRNTGQVIVEPSDLPGKVSCSPAEGGRFGTGPILCEGIEAVLSFSGLGGRMRCYALDPDGNVLQEIPVSSKDSGEAVLLIGPGYKTVWYKVIVDA